MKVARYLEANQPFRILDEPEPQGTSGEMIVRVAAAGICATDAKIVRGKRNIKPGIILGHEIAGEIVEIFGENLLFARGDRVGIFPGLPCQKCYYCQNGYKHLCGSKISLGLQVDGGFQQYMRIPANMVAYGNVVKLPPDMSFQEATLLEPISCCLQAYENVKMNACDKTLIVGAGSMGLLHLILFKSLGAQKIIVSDPLAQRRELALQLGACRVIDAFNEDLVKIILEETNSIGVDVCFFCADDPMMIGRLCDAVRKRGSINLFSSSTKDLKAVIDPNKLHYKEIIMTGSHSSTLEYYKQSFSIFKPYREQLNKLITHTFSLDEINNALQMYLSNQALKALIEP